MFSLHLHLHLLLFLTSTFTSTLLASPLNSAAELDGSGWKFEIREPSAFRADAMNSSDDFASTNMIPSEDWKSECRQRNFENARLWGHHLDLNKAFNNFCDWHGGGKLNGVPRMKSSIRYGGGEYSWVLPLDEEPKAIKIGWNNIKGPPAWEIELTECYNWLYYDILNECRDDPQAIRVNYGCLVPGQCNQRSLGGWFTTAYGYVTWEILPSYW